MRSEISRQCSARRRGALAVLPIVAGAVLASPAVAAQAQPGWSVSRPAQREFGRLWRASLAERRERVGCLGGVVREDSVFVTRVEVLPSHDADSIAAGADSSLSRCAAPAWIGTIHTHVRSTDDPRPAPRFSADDRGVMSAWTRRWERRGAFCVLHSDRAAHCEVYPPAR